MTAAAVAAQGPRVFDADTATVPPFAPATGLFEADTDTGQPWLTADAPTPLRDTPLPPGLREFYVVDTDEPGGGGQARLYLCHAVDGSGPVVVRRSWSLSHGTAGRIHPHRLDGLEHHNIVRRVRPSVENEGSLFEVLEFCAGGSLGRRQRLPSPGPDGRTHRPMETADLHAVVEAMAGALRYLHEEQGILHTDIKPDNILVRSIGQPLSPDAICLADFGSAMAAQPPRAVSGQTARTPQFSAEDDRYTEKWDWYQVGLTLIALATGAHDPAQRRPTRQDFDRLDPRVSVLIRGLLTPWRDVGNRWGYPQVQRWLQGEDVPLTGVDVADQLATGRGTFLVHFDGKDCMSPDELGDRMSERWEAALRAVQGFLGRVPFVEAVADQLEATGDPHLPAVRALVGVTVGDPQDLVEAVPGQRHPEVFLAELICALNPHGVPKIEVVGFPPVDLTRSGLTTIAGNAWDAMVPPENSGRGPDPDDPWVVAQERLFRRNLLQILSTMGDAAAPQGDFSWLRQVDAAWHEAFRAVGHRLNLAVPGVESYRAERNQVLADAGQQTSGRLQFQESEWERFVGSRLPDFGIRVRSSVLKALVDDVARHEDATTAAQLAATDDLVAQSWFAQVAGVAPPASRRGGRGAAPGRPGAQPRRGRFWPPWAIFR